MYNRNSVIECATNCLPAILPVEQKNQWKSVFNNDTALGLVRKAKSNYLNCKMAEKQKFFRLFVYEIRSAELFLEKKPKERLARQEELDDYIKFAADESKRVDEDLAEDSIDRFGFKEPTQALEYSTRKAIEFIKKIRSDITEEKGSLAVELMKKQQKKRLWSEFYLKQIFKAKKEYDQGPTEFEPVREHTINRLKLFDNFLFALLQAEDYLKGNEKAPANGQRILDEYIDYAADVANELSESERYRLEESPNSPGLVAKGRERLEHAKDFAITAAKIAEALNDYRVRRKEASSKNKVIVNKKEDSKPSDMFSFFKVFNESPKISPEEEIKLKQFFTSKEFIAFLKQIETLEKSLDKKTVDTNTKVDGKYKQSKLVDLLNILGKKKSLDEVETALKTFKTDNDKDLNASRGYTTSVFKEIAQQFGRSYRTSTAARIEDLQNAIKDIKDHPTGPDAGLN